MLWYGMLLDPTCHCGWLAGCWQDWLTGLADRVAVGIMGVIMESYGLMMCDDVCMYVCLFSDVCGKAHKQNKEKDAIDSVFSRETYNVGRDVPHTGGLLGGI